MRDCGHVTNALAHTHACAPSHARSRPSLFPPYLSGIVESILGTLGRPKTDRKQLAEAARGVLHLIYKHCPSVCVQEDAWVVVGCSGMCVCVRGDKHCPSVCVQEDSWVVVGCSGMCVCVRGVCMCVCVYVCAGCVYVYMCVCMCVYVYVCMCVWGVYMCVCVYVCMWVCMCIYVYVCVGWSGVCVCICVCVCMYACARHCLGCLLPLTPITNIHSYTHTRTHTCIYSYIHAHTRANTYTRMYNTGIYINAHTHTYI